MLRIASVLPLLAGLLLLALPARALEGGDAAALRAQEIAECRPAEITHWGDGRDRPALASPLRLVYDPAGAPPWFAPQQVLQALLRAAEAWSGGCGVPATVLPLAPGASAERLPEGTVLVQWNDAQVRGHFGLAHVGLRRLWLGAQAFHTLRTRNPAHPAETTLQMVISHEMGHLFGLMAHSSRCVDVMSYYTNGQGERCQSRADITRWRGDYRALLPTACDLARCRAVNAGAQTAQR